jgi:hypothetical protein
LTHLVYLFQFVSYFIYIDVWFPCIVL